MNSQEAAEKGQLYSLPMSIHASCSLEVTGGHEAGDRLHPSGKTSKYERRGRVNRAFALKGTGKEDSGWKRIQGQGMGVLSLFLRQEMILQRNIGDQKRKKLAAGVRFRGWDPQSDGGLDLGSGNVRGV